MTQVLIKKASISLLTLTGLLVSVAWFAGLFDDKVSPSIAEPQVKKHKNIFTVTPQHNIVFEPVAASVTAKQASIISSREDSDIRTRRFDC